MNVGAAWTVTVACIDGWISQKYGKLPVWLKVNGKVALLPRFPLRKVPVMSPGTPDVTV